VVESLFAPIDWNPISVHADCKDSLTPTCGWIKIFETFAKCKFPLAKSSSFTHSSIFFHAGCAVSGFFLRNFSGVETTCFGISVPPVFAVNGYWATLARSSRFWVSYIFLAFIGLHILAHWKVVRSRLRSFLPISHKTRLRSKIANTTLIPTPTSVADTNLDCECNTLNPPTSGIPVDRGD